MHLLAFYEPRLQLSKPQYCRHVKRYFDVPWDFSAHTHMKRHYLFLPLMFWCDLIQPPPNCLSHLTASGNLSLTHTFSRSHIDTHDTLCETHSHTMFFSCRSFWLCAEQADWIEASKYGIYGEITHPIIQYDSYFKLGNDRDRDG